MVDRINLILKAKNLTSRQFAEEIGIQPSGMSHILSGRNRPSLDFVMKVVNRYPEIDLRWLTFGEGQMYNTSVSNPTNKVNVSPANGPSEPTVQPDLFSMMELESVEPEENTESYSLPESSTIPEQRPEPELEPILEQNPKAIPEPILEQNPKPISEPILERKSEPMSEQTPAPHNKPYPCPEPKRETASFVTEEAVVPVPQKTKSHAKRIVKFVVLYDDHTFAEYFPE